MTGGAPTGLTPGRLAVLEFQAHNFGMNRSQVERVVKQGQDPSKTTNGPMIQISPIELAELLRVYQEHMSCASPG